MKKSKVFLKWLICVVLTFTTVFSIRTIINTACIAGAIYNLAGDEINDYIKENVKQNAENYDDYYKTLVEETQDEELKELYNKYPAGFIVCVLQDLRLLHYGRILINSLLIGLILGTTIFLISDKSKKEIKILLVLYMISIIILGFVEGINTIYGENLSMLDYWIFPEDSIIPATIIFAIVVIIYVIKQKNIAKKLNEKL